MPETDNPYAPPLETCDTARPRKRACAEVVAAFVIVVVFSATFGGVSANVHIMNLKSVVWVEPLIAGTILGLCHLGATAMASCVFKIDLAHRLAFWTVHEVIAIGIVVGSIAAVPVLVVWIRPLLH